MERDLLLSFLLVIISIISPFCIGDEPVVDTPLGRMKGIEVLDKMSGEPVFQFRGIRFATAERFKKPKKIEAWTETYDATKFGNACPQLNIEFVEGEIPETSEDCLFLNVYVPRNLNKKRSVMVWIHGGGLVVGHSHYYDGTRIAVDGDVIFVSINYRLGILGFMALNHPASRGNYGLWDQKLALQWVHDNIASFGGDSQSVTIFGESAGGWSVSYQSLIPSNEGLFQRVIAQSGVVSRTGMLQNDAIQKFIRDIPGRTNCSASDMYKFVECLREAPVDVLLQATDFFQDLTDEGIKLDFFVGPSVDGDLYPKHPLLLLNDPNSEQAKFFKSLDFIAGTVEQEGSLVYMEVSPQIMDRYKFDIDEKIPPEFVCQGMVKPFVETYHKNNEDIYKTMCDFYTKDTDSTLQSVRAADLYADIIFTPATAEMLDQHARLGGRTYQYIFSKLSPKRFGSEAPKWFQTNGHGDDLMFLFHVDNDGKDGFFDVKMENENLNVSKTTIQYWTSFAKTGVPCAGESGLPWLEYETDKKIYMDFDVDISLKQRAKNKAVKFWLEELPPIDLNSPYVLHDEF